MLAVMRGIKWFYHEFGLASVHEAGRNAYLIILTRAFRMFAFGMSSVIFVIFFSALGFSDHQIGLFMTLILVGDVFVGAVVVFMADRVGRRKVLLAGSIFMVASGIAFALSDNFWILLVAAVFGVISASGSDFGPFRSLEESVLFRITTPETRPDVIAWHVTTATLTSSLGSEASGRIIAYLQGFNGWQMVDMYHMLFWAYVVVGIMNAVLVLLLSEDCELQDENATYVEISQDEEAYIQPLTSSTPLEGPEDKTLKSRGARLWKVWAWFSSPLGGISASTLSIMYKLWLLVAVDMLADGMTPYSITNYYLDTKFHPTRPVLGDIAAVRFLLAAFSSIFAGPLSRRMGLLNTMVFALIPSSLVAILLPLAPQLWLAACLLFVRAGVQKMYQAPRTTFIAAIVKPKERTAVMGVTSIIYTLAAIPGPSITGLLASGNRFWIAFVVAGSCRLIFAVGLYASFGSMKLHQHETDYKSSFDSRSLTEDSEYVDSLEMDKNVGSKNKDDFDKRRKSTDEA
ncbi:MFS general substrate transporter [Trichoderma ceciliae]